MQIDELKIPGNGYELAATLFVPGEQKADHAIHDEKMNEEYIRLMADWFVKTL